MQRAYKFVFRNKRREGRLQSMWAEGMAVVVYRPGEEVTAPDWLERQGHGLFVFDTLKDAVESIWFGEPCMELWAVNVAEEIPLPTRLELHTLSCGDIRPARSEYGVVVQDWAIGTRTYRRVTLERPVTVDEVRRASERVSV